MRALRWMLGFAAGIALLACVAWAWLLYSTSGARFIVARAESATGLSVSDIDGAIASGLRLRGAGAPAGNRRARLVLRVEGRFDGEPPADELVAVEPGVDHGWPRCVGDNRPVAEYGHERFDDAPYRGFYRRFDQENDFPEMAGRDLRARFDFDLDAGVVLHAKVALSGVSAAGALANLEEEAPGWDFDGAGAAACSSGRAARSNTRPSGRWGGSLRAGWSARAPRGGGPTSDPVPDGPRRDASGSGTSCPCTARAGTARSATRRSRRVPARWSGP